MPSAGAFHGLTWVSSRWPLLPFFCVLVTLRLLAAREPIWLDEVLAFRWMEVLPHFHSIFTAYFSENNHFVQSAWLFLVKDASSPYLQRAFSLCCSLLFVGLLFLKAYKEGGWRIPLFLLCGTSYFFLLYGTEARGYSPLLLGLYFVFEVGLAAMQRFTPWNVFLFWCASIFAIGSHVSAFSFLGAYLLELWASLGFFRAALLGVPSVLLLVVLYVFFLSALTEAGGDVGNELNALIDLFGLGVGGPIVQAHAVGIFGLLVAFGSFVWLLRLSVIHAFSRKSMWIFFLNGIYVIPILSWFGYGPEYTYPRHFLPALFVCYLFLSQVLYDSWQRGAKNRAVVLAFLAFFVIGNFWHSSTLLRVGRGDYREVVRILESNPAPIAFDQAYRHQTMLNYYGTSRGSSFARLPLEEQPPYPNWARLPDWLEQDRKLEFAWFLSQGPARSIPAPIQPEDLVLHQVVTAAPLSGWSTYIYQIPGSILSAKSSAGGNDVSQKN